jgi:ketosteroid isomerase-like protein
MKNNIYILIALISSTPAIAQKHILTDNKQIISILQVQQASWNEGDINGFMKYYWNNDSLTFIGKKGITYGWQQTYNNYLQSYPDKTAMGELNFDITSVELLSKTVAYVVGKWYLKRDESKGDLSGHFTLLFKKIDGRWVIVSDHSS